jgi:hypothetical protein
MCGLTNSTAYNHFHGKECLDLHLLKPARLDVPPGHWQPNVVCADDMQPAPAWLEYPFHKSHPILHRLPSKLEAWISYNCGQELGIPPQGLPRVDGRELNAILEDNLVPSHCVKGQLQTFGCIQWKWERNSGRPKARCYPFNLAGDGYFGEITVR